MKKVFITLAVLFAVAASSMAQTFQITGPTTVYGDISVWYVENEPAGTDYTRMYCSVVSGNVTYPEDEYQFDHYRITPSGTGTIRLVAQAEWGGQWTNYFYVTVVENPNPPVPPTPSIGGANNVTVNSTEAYSMPSGKQDYEWIMPFSGCYHVQEYNNLKVIGFTSPGNRTLKGRYKEGGVWSEYGIKNIVVSY
jgi:hypothetical protein